MCRLLGYVASHPTSAANILGPESFKTFTALTAVHGDGWGMAWHEGDDPKAHVANSADSAALDPRYDELAHRPVGSAGIVHLRWATGGLPVTRENTHPFADGGYALAHNGNIAPRRRLEDMLTASSRAKLKGDTDSERYFRYVLQCIDEDGDEAAGITRAIQTLHSQFPESSLNALILTPKRMFAVHINSDAISPSEALHDMFDSSEESMPADHESEYFAMSYRITADAVHVISSGLGEEGWSPVLADNAVMIDLETREVTRLDPLTCELPMAGSAG